MFSIYINLCQIHSLYKCQIFQLYNFYDLYVLNTSHKLYLYMKLYMVSELSTSCVLFTLTHPPPPPRSMCGRYASYWNVLRYRSNLQILHNRIISFIVLSSDNTNCKNDIQLFPQLFDELSVHRDYH